MYRTSKNKKAVDAFKGPNGNHIGGNNPIDEE